MGEIDNQAKRAGAGRASNLALALFAAWTLATQASAAPRSILGQDVFCRSINLNSSVATARAEATHRAQLSRRLSGRPEEPQGDPTVALMAEWDIPLNLPRLKVTGTGTQWVGVESASNLAAPSWQPLLTLNFTGSEIDWSDITANPEAGRFYRLSQPAADPTQETVDNFLLIDTQGLAQQLFYPNNLSALVVIAVGDSLAELGAVWTSVKGLTQAYSTNSVQVWAVVSDPTATRAQIAAAAAALGVSIPLLPDPFGIALEATGLSHAGEAVVVQPPLFTVAYRGAVGGQSEALLESAVSNLVAGAAPVILRTPALGSLLAAKGAATPDYSRDVAPILYQYCANCHRPEDVAPFAMTNYDVVASWAPVIKAALLANLMPPWHADTDYGQWANDLGLPAAARATLLQWVDGGAQRGSGPDPLATNPIPPSYRSWPAELGPPDAIVTPGLQPVKATGSEDYRYIFVQTPNPTNVWLRAAVILPSAPAVVHHYLVWSGRIGNQGLPGLSTYQSSLAGYVPGMTPYVYPTNSGVNLSPSNWLTFNLHYTPNGEATNDLPQLALWYWKSPPARTFHEDSAQNLLLDIPPGVADSPIQAVHTFNRAATLYRLNPHMHLRGKRMQFTAVYPNGTREVLLSVPDYSFLWQLGYQLATPKVMPAGTTILVDGAFDNSPQNPYNPDPTADVFWGDQTGSEMFVGFIDYTD